MFWCVFVQPQSASDTMPKKGKKKTKVVEKDSDLEIMPRAKIIYEDTKSVTDAEPSFKWEQIYHMLQDREVLDAGLEDLPLFGNILRSGITKVSMRPELFPCVEMISWIFPKCEGYDYV